MCKIAHPRPHDLPVTYQVLQPLSNETLFYGVSNGYLFRISRCRQIIADIGK